MALDDQTKAELLELFARTLDERARITPAEHGEHHNFIREQIKEIKRKRDFRMAVKKQVAGWGIIATLGALSAWFGEHFLRMFK